MKVENLNIGVMAKIRHDLFAQTPSQIVYDIPMGSDFGIRYFTKDAPLSENGPIVHITYPNAYRFSEITRYGDVGVWRDARTGSFNYLTTDNYILKTSSLVRLYKNEYPTTQATDKPVDAYVIVKEETESGSVQVAKSEYTQIEWVNECVDRVNAQQSAGWVVLAPNVYCSIQHNLAILVGSSLQPTEFHLEIL